VDQAGTMDGRQRRPGRVRIRASPTGIRRLRPPHRPAAALTRRPPGRQ
jgi:hypothetical protein